MKNALLLILISLISCMSPSDSSIMLIPEETFITEIDGQSIGLYRLTNSNGLTSEITNYGARVVSLWIPDREGQFEDVVLGHDNITDYQVLPDPFYGSAVGRYANRIGNAKFTIDDTDYQVDVNDGKNHLHGGVKGFHRVVWGANQISDNKLQLTYTSPDGEMGYPGNLEVILTYELTESNELTVSYEASTDQPTLCNLSHHSYFNLLGAGNGTINQHELYINADQYTPVDSTLIPTGQLESVAGTPFDFREPKVIGQDLANKHDQLILGKGYDHNWALSQNTDGLTLAARVYEPATGRQMEVLTSQPGIQFYGGNWLDGTSIGKNGKAYRYREALCLETQTFPDSPNKPNFPSPVLRPGEVYKSTCIYRFSTK